MRCVARAALVLLLAAAATAQSGSSDGGSSDGLIDDDDMVDDGSRAGSAMDSSGSGDSTPEPEPEQATLDTAPPTVATVVTTVASVGSAANKAHLEAQLLATLPAGSTVVAAMVQKASIPLGDDGTLCPAIDSDAAHKGAAEQGMGEATGIHSGSAWKAGCSIAAGACVSASGRRRMQTHTIAFASEATEDISAEVKGGSFAATFATRLSAAAAALPTPIVIDAAAYAAAATVDPTAIAYETVVTYTVTTAAPVTAAAMTGHLTAAITEALVASGVDRTDAATAATAAAATMVVTVAGSGGGGVAVASAKTAAVSAGIVAAAVGAMFL